MLELVVPVKQVPETADVAMDPETGTMIREGRRAVLNPLDLYAVEAALALRERTGGRITVLTMGPADAGKALREALSMGCDDAVLVTDRRFAGSDTWATSYVLSRAIARLGKVDLVVCGERAVDGDTGQVGPGIAAWLNLPFATFVSKLGVPGDGRLRAERLVEDGREEIEMTLPGLVTVVKEIAVPRLPTLTGKKRARRAELRTLDADDLGLDPTMIGLAGSPTRVVRIETPKIARGGEILRPRTGGEMTAAIERLARTIAGTVW